MNAERSAEEAHGGTLFFVLLGGGLAWLAHLLGLWVIAEFGCLSGLREVFLLGVTGVAWLVFIATLLTAAVSAAAMVMGLRLVRRSPDEVENRSSMARTGWILNALFLLVILVEAAPVFFFLSDC